MLTENQQQIYVLLLMAGRNEEAENYKRNCEKIEEVNEQ